MPNLHCLDPSSTMKYVENCPNSKYTWDRAAERKGCHRISKNCVSLPKQDLKYHCLINPYVNETVEVCAPSQRIFGGFCPEYSILAGRVQENFNVDCKKFKSPCPTFFMSTDAYKHQECYTRINRRTTQSAIETSTKRDTERTNSTSSTESNTNTGLSFHVMIIMLGTIVVVVFILLVIGKMMWTRKKLKQRFCWKNEDVKSEKAESSLDNVADENDYHNPDPISHLLSGSNNPDHCITDVHCIVQTHQSSAGIARNGNVFNNGMLYDDNKYITNNGHTKERRPDG